VSELAAQWPIVLLVMAVSGVFLRVIQQQYERMIANLEEDVQLWRDLALSGTDLASRMTSVVEHQVKRRP
jgi:F420-dependent methylenetetrahydromethanopterin dehydrogenase